MMRDTSYAIVSAVRDEEEYLEKTVQSVVSQTMRPGQWVIVNDGSRDRTGEIIQKWEKTHPWIRGVHREDRGFRKAGGGVIEAFYEGYRLLGSEPWDFLVKLDGDLSFEPVYFERCFEYFEKNPRLGIGGGCICHWRDGVLEREDTPGFHVRGATKIYRRDCWQSIGSLLQAPGWDTLDEVKANMMGWQTRTFWDLNVIHHRHVGAADGSWANSKKNGLANYIAGYHPLFMILKCLRRIPRKPHVIGSIGLFCGFFGGYFQSVKRVEDGDLIRFLRREQLKMIFGKESIWK